MDGSKGLLLAACCAAACLMHFPATAHAGNAERVRLRAEAEDDATDLRFKATYKERSEDDRSRQKFKVRVWDGIPGEMLAVSVNGLFLDWIHVNHNGNGRFRYRSDDMPDALPAFQTGDVVTVGPLEQVFKNRDESGKSNRTRIRLRARTTPGEIVYVDVRYDTRTRKDRLRRWFRVSVDGAVAGDDLDVLVNGELIGTIEIDEWNDGKLRLRSRGADTDKFPMMHEGDTLMVGDTSLTLSIN